MHGKNICGLTFRVLSYCSFRRKVHSKNTKRLLDFIAEMPKGNGKHIAEAQNQRKFIQKKSEKYGPSTVYLQVLGTGARGVPNTLYLFTDQKRYLFNCGECTQRLAHEHRVKLSRLEHIFITTKTWKNLGGLPGLSLTLQDVGIPNITLHGPDGLDELYTATQRFVIMKDMNISMAKVTPFGTYEDNVMTVKYITLTPPDTDIPVINPKKPRLENQDYGEFMHDDTDYYMRGNKEATKPVVVNKPKTQNTKKIDFTDTRNCSIAYICTLKKRLGTLDLARCVERGVRPGPLLGRLKAGEDVVLPSGDVVRSQDVKTPDDPGPVFIVLDVPSMAHLDQRDFSKHFAGSPVEDVPVLVVHYTAPEVLNQPAYREFMDKFGPDCQHMILNEDNTCLGSEAVHRTQHKLNLLDDEIFPLLRDSSIPTVWDSEGLAKLEASGVKGLDELKNKIAKAQFQDIITKDARAPEDAKLRPGSLAVFHLRPARGLDRSQEPRLHISSYLQETLAEGFLASLERFRARAQEQRRLQPAAEYPKVVFLGTGSCIPSKTRNTSGIAIMIDEDRSMLLDCGEGTRGQLARLWGARRAARFLRSLRAVYVSHLHADHHIGLIGVLQARRSAYAEAGQPPPPLYLAAPGQIMAWLALYDANFEPLLKDITLVPNQALRASSEPDAAASALLAALSARSLATCYVSHCPNAFGMTLQLESCKITYSGDTIPCDELVQLGMDSTLLIHEATMEDELEAEARAKMHSTTSQAIDIGERMRAQYTLLTHFSQRYARIPRLSAQLLRDKGNVGIAFDNMQVRICDLPLLSQMYEPLQLMFAEHCQEMDQKAANRAQKAKAAELQCDQLKSDEDGSKTTIVSTASDKSLIDWGTFDFPTLLTSVASQPASRTNYIVRETITTRLRKARTYNIDNKENEPKFVFGSTYRRSPKSSIYTNKGKSIARNDCKKNPTMTAEDLRKAKLKEAKNKFLTKSYKDRAIFEKIEGLNWISWK